jgi:hypothetical protein
VAGAVGDAGGPVEGTTPISWLFERPGVAGSQSWLTPALDRQPTLWVLALLLYGVGDSATTFVGMRDGTAAEVGPVAVRVLGHGGIGGLLALKVGLFVVCFVVWYAVRTPGRVAIPLALAVTGFLVTAWNAVVLVT